MLKLTVAQGKGGVAKTTTAVHIAAGLARHGRRTLLVDLDSQRDATKWAGLEEEPQLGLEDVLLRGADPHRVIVEGRWPGLRVLPAVRSQVDGGIDVGIALAGRLPIKLLLRSVLDQLDQAYEFAVLDCPPRVSLVVQNGLAAADWLLAPIEPSNLAMSGLSDFVSQVEGLRGTALHSARWLGLLPVKLAPRERMTRAAITELTAAAEAAAAAGLELRIFNGVPRRAGIEAWIKAGQVAEPESDVGRAYEAVTTAVLELE